MDGILCKGCVANPVHTYSGRYCSLYCLVCINETLSNNVVEAYQHGYKTILTDKIEDDELRTRFPV